jgi:nucleoside-diphosphate-sugar epimerase
MRILIIGGTGLISTSTAHLLSMQGEKVVLFNRGQSLYPTAPGVTTLHGDRTNYAAFEAQMSGAGAFDVVIDMVAYKPEDGKSAVRAFRGKVGQFIFCSTVDVYNKPATAYPYTEQDVYGGLNEYSHNKVILEKYLLRAEQEGAFPLTIIRPAYTYGEGRGPIHPVSWDACLDRIRRGKPVVVHGDGQSMWVCNHASDVGRTFAVACGNPKTFGQAYHVTGEEWLTWDQYIRQIAEALGVACPRLVHIPSATLAQVGITICAENFQYDNIFDNSKAHRDLSYQYTITWKEGVQRMAKWFDGRGKWPNCNEHPFEDRLIDAWESMGIDLVKRLTEGSST